jgi:hypothetical protein
VSKVLLPGALFVFDFPNREHVSASQNLDSLADENKLKFDHTKPVDKVDPYFYYGAESDESIAQKLKLSGFSLEKRVPYGLLTANALLFGHLTSRQLQRRERLIGAAIKFSPSIRSLFEQLEKNITPFVPSQLVHGSFVVARKS